MPTWAILTLGLSAVVLIGMPGRLGSRRLRLPGNGWTVTYALERTRYAIMSIAGVVIWILLVLFLRHAYLG